MKFKDLSSEEIIKAIKELETFPSILKALECSITTYNRTKLKLFIEDNKINIDHVKIPGSRSQYEPNPKRCKQCGKIIPYEKRLNDFCDHSCSASYNNKGVVRNGNPHQKTYCLNCGKELTDYHSKYCGHICQNEYEFKLWVERWKRGEESGIRGSYGISGYLKRYLLEKFHYKCSRCGWQEVNPYTRKIPLEVDHIDGNYQNNAENNLTILCPNCHSLTATYKGANKGHGRKERSQYS